MFRLTIAKRILVLLASVFALSLCAQAQEDCVYGYKIYVRNEMGEIIEMAKHEVSGLTKKDVLTPKVKLYTDKDGSHMVSGFGGSTVKGDYVLRVSAEGFETYERQFKFPVCEIQSFELRLRPKGSTRKVNFERLFTLHGKVFDEDRKPFVTARIEARSADGRIYETFSNAYGYYKFDLPKGVTNIRVTNSKIPDVVFDAYQIDRNYSVLNVPVCLKCKQKESGN